MVTQSQCYGQGYWITHLYRNKIEQQLSHLDGITDLLYSKHVQTSLLFVCCHPCSVHNALDEFPPMPHIYFCFQATAKSAMGLFCWLVGKKLENFLLELILHMHLSVTFTMNGHQRFELREKI
jgi:hypothetical protein